MTRRLLLVLGLSFQVATGAFGQAEWNWRTPPFLQPVLYEDGQLVAVAKYGWWR